MKEKKDTQGEMQDEKAKPDYLMAKEKRKISRRVKMRRNSLLSRWQERRNRYSGR